MQVIINKGEISKIAKHISNNSNLLLEESKKINTIVSNINNAWEGSDAAKFITALEMKYITELEKMSKCIEEFGKYLENVPKVYSLLDDTFTSKNIEV